MLRTLEYPVIIQVSDKCVKSLRYLSNTYSSPWNRTSQILLIIQSIVKHKKRGVLRPLYMPLSRLLRLVVQCLPLWVQSTLQTPGRWRMRRPVVRCHGG